MKAKKVLKYVGRVLLVIFVTLVLLVGTVYLVLHKICKGPSPAAKAELGSSLLESGQLKFVAKLVLSKEEIDEITKLNERKPMNTDVLDDSLIHIVNEENPDPDVTPDPSIPEEEFDENGVRIVKIAGRSFLAKLMIIKDPSQVKVGTTYPYGEYGKNLHEIVANSGAVGGVNGGLYESTGNKGGQPLGVVVQDGVINCNRPQSNKGLYMIGLTKDNILQIKDIQGYSTNDVERYVAEAKIRDAVCFQEESSDSNNHFVPLIINGEGREMNGQGSGANPRTVIAQRSDGAIMLLVTDGRAANGHLGATAADLIAILLEYGAVNAANLDGGSSSTMVYKGEYEMPSVTFYYNNKSWNMPTAFVVMPK